MPTLEHNSVLVFLYRNSRTLPSRVSCKNISITKEQTVLLFTHQQPIYHVNNGNTRHLSQFEPNYVSKKTFMTWIRDLNQLIEL